MASPIFSDVKHGQRCVDRTKGVLLLQVRHISHRDLGQDGDVIYPALRDPTDEAFAKDFLDDDSRTTNATNTTMTTTTTVAAAITNTTTTTNPTTTNTTTTNTTTTNTTTTNTTTTANTTTATTTTTATSTTITMTSNTTCLTRYDPRVTYMGYTASPAGTLCMFGVDDRDEGQHCIMDQGQYGSLGWCYTSQNKSSFGACSEGCPLFGQAKILGQKIDNISNVLQGIKLAIDDASQVVINISRTIAVQNVSTTLPEAIVKKAGGGYVDASPPKAL